MKKKLLIPSAVAATLLLGTAAVFADGSLMTANTMTSTTAASEVAVKKTGLENALSKVKNEKAKTVIQAKLDSKETLENRLLDSLTVGGENVLKLDGLQSTAGAALKADTSEELKSIVVTPVSNATVTVTLNGTEVTPENLANTALKVDDVIVVTVKSGDVTQTYSLKVMAAPVTLTLGSFTIGGMDVSKLKGLSTEVGAKLEVEDEDLAALKGIVASAKEQNITAAVTVNGTAVTAEELANVTLKANDVIVLTLTSGETKASYKVTVVLEEEADKEEQPEQKPEKKTGLENALTHVKNEQAKLSIEKNIAKKAAKAPTAVKVETKAKTTVTTKAAVKPAVKPAMKKSMNASVKKATKAAAKTAVKVKGVAKAQTKVTNVKAQAALKTNVEHKEDSKK